MVNSTKTDELNRFSWTFTTRFLMGALAIIWMATVAQNGFGEEELVNLCMLSATCMSVPA